MCLVVMALEVNPDWPFVVAANRDEFYARPTQPLHAWPDAPEILAGRDVQAGGTWMGLTRGGRFACLTNFREPAAPVPGAPSRGGLVTDFLRGPADMDAWLAKLARGGDAYAGFSLVFGHVNPPSLACFSNRGTSVRRLEPGIHVLSNHLLDTPWPKVRRVRASLESLLGIAARVEAEPLFAGLFAVLADRAAAPDDELPETGVDRQWERQLSPPFVTSSEYGTRSSTVMGLDAKGGMHLEERTFERGSSAYERVRWDLCLP